jgi:hypothetical protein
LLFNTDPFIDDVRDDGCCAVIGFEYPFSRRAD